jgi:hypothetical protein
MAKAPVSKTGVTVTGLGGSNPSPSSLKSGRVGIAGDDGNWRVGRVDIAPRC